MPTINDLTMLIKHVKSQITENDRSFNGENEPGIQLSIACDDAMDGWAYQTGDNSFTGPCYFFQHWAVTGIYRDTDCRKEAKSLLNELRETVEEYLADQVD